GGGGGGAPPNDATHSMKFQSPSVALAMGSSAGPVIVGQLSKSDQFGGITLVEDVQSSSIGLGDAYVVAFDASAKALWGNRYGDQEAQLANAAASNASGVTLVSGFFTGTLQFSPTVTLTSTDEVAFIAALKTGTGEALWAQSVDLGGGAISAIAVDPMDQSF